MALKSTRERFNSNNLEKKSNIKSKLSDIARAPRNYVPNQNVDKTFIEKQNKQNPNKEYQSKQNQHLSTSHSYKKQLSSYDEMNFVYDENRRLIANKEKVVKKKSKIGLIVLCICLFIIELLTLGGIYAAHYAVKMANLPQKVDYKPTTYIPPGKSEDYIKSMDERFITVAIFGLDSRDSSLGKGNNSDVIIVACADFASGKIKLVSVYRDTYLNIIKPNVFTKINAAYMHGGPQNAIDALNKNLDLSIQNYFSFNWKAVADGIDALGGIDLDINPREYVYMNAFIHETCVKSGISKKNPAAMYIDHAGYQHLNGVQAVAYCRLRKMDSDLERVKRQKKVISLCLQKAKETDVAELLRIANVVLPEIQYYFEYEDIVKIATNIKGFSISETTAFPVKLLGETMGPNGDCIIPNTLESNVTTLHKLLFDVDDYEPSSTVRTFSNTIMEKYRYYRDENKIKKENEAVEKNRNDSKPVDDSTEKKKNTDTSKDVNSDENKNKDNENNKSQNADPNKAIENNNSTGDTVVIPDIGVSTGGDAPTSDATKASNENSVAGDNIEKTNNSSAPFDSKNDATNQGLTPSNGLTTPTGNSTTPTGDSTTPTGNSTTPTGNSSTPTGNSTTPTGNSATPITNPTENSSPINPVNSPTTTDTANNQSTTNPIVVDAPGIT